MMIHKAVNSRSDIERFCGTKKKKKEFEDAAV